MNCVESKSHNLILHERCSRFSNLVCFSSATTAQRKVSSDRKSSMVSERRESSVGRRSSSFRDGSSGEYSRKSSTKSSAGSYDYSGSLSNDYSGLRRVPDYSSAPREKTSFRSESPGGTRIGLSALK